MYFYNIVGLHASSPLDGSLIIVEYKLCQTEFPVRSENMDELHILFN